jgi:hypothetical protein
MPDGPQPMRHPWRRNAEPAFTWSHAVCDPAPTTFVQNAYWQLIMAEWARWRPVDASGSRKISSTSSVRERGLLFEGGW